MCGTRISFIPIAIIASSYLAAVASAEVPDVTQEEYALYMDWVEGRQDPRLEGQTEVVQMRKIARSLGVRLKALKAAIAKVEPVAKNIASATEEAIGGRVATTPMKGRVAEIVVDARQGHVIAWMKWRCGDARDSDKEAAYLAWAVGQTSSIVKTIGLWCVNDAGTKLFSAKIAKTAAARINKSSIERFAGSRYIKLFEEVKRGPHK